MSNSPYRSRGIGVVVDTTRLAEEDAQKLGIDERSLARIGNSLRDVPVSPSDREVNGVRIRLMAGLDVVFIVGREPDNIVVTIGGFRTANSNDPTEKLVQRLGIVAIFRGATGV